MTPTLAFWKHHLHKKCGFILIMQKVDWKILEKIAHFDCFNKLLYVGTVLTLYAHCTQSIQPSLGIYVV